jgi:hypothetical protein
LKEAHPFHAKIANLSGLGYAVTWAATLNSRNRNVQKPSKNRSSPHARRGTRTGGSRKRNPNPGRERERQRAGERRAVSPTTNPTHPLALVAGSDGRGAAAGGADRAVLGAGNGAVQLRAAAGRAGARGHLPPGALRLLRALRPPGPRQGTRRGRWALPCSPFVARGGVGLGLGLFSLSHRVGNPSRVGWFS